MHVFSIHGVVLKTRKLEIMHWIQGDKLRYDLLSVSGIESKFLEDMEVTQMIKWLEEDATAHSQTTNQNRELSDLRLTGKGKLHLIIFEQK